MKVEGAVLGSPSLISLMVSVDVKHYERRSETLRIRAQELCESRGGRPGLPVPNKPDGFCGRKAPWKKKKKGTPPTSRPPYQPDLTRRAGKRVR